MKASKRRNREERGVALAAILRNAGRHADKRGGRGNRRSEAKREVKKEIWS